METCLLETLVIVTHLHLSNELVYEQPETYNLNGFNKLKWPARNPNSWSSYYQVSDKTPCFLVIHKSVHNGLKDSRTIDGNVLINGNIMEIVHTKVIFWKRVSWDQSGHESDSSVHDLGLFHTLTIWKESGGGRRWQQEETIFCLTYWPAINLSWNQLYIFIKGCILKVGFLYS